MKNEIKLGCKAKDIITGFTGIVVCISEWINGCRRITVQPQEVRDGKPLESQTFDVEQMECLEADAVKLVVSPTGGPSIPPVQRRDPR